MSEMNAYRKAHPDENEALDAFPGSAANDDGGNARGPGSAIEIDRDRVPHAAAVRSDLLCAKPTASARRIRDAAPRYGGRFHWVRGVRDPNSHSPSISDLAPPPRWIEPELCKLVTRIPAGDNWAHEIKFDGFRMHARIVGPCRAADAQRARLDGQVSGHRRRNRRVQLPPGLSRRRTLRGAAGRHDVIRRLAGSWGCADGAWCISCSICCISTARKDASVGVGGPMLTNRP